MMYIHCQPYDVLHYRHSPTSGNMFYIGSMSLTGSDSDRASRCSNVSTAWLLPGRALPTCLHSWNPAAIIGFHAPLQRRRTPVSTICSPWPACELDVDVPRVVRLATYRGCAFCHAWNALPVCPKNNQLYLFNCRHQLKHFYFSSY